MSIFGLDVAIYGESQGFDELSPIGIIVAVYFWGTVLPFAGLGARRLHDIGYSGWYQLMWLTGIGILWVVLAAAVRSELEPNSYGDPQTTGSGFAPWDPPAEPLPEHGLMNVDD